MNRGIKNDISKRGSIEEISKRIFFVLYLQAQEYFLDTTNHYSRVTIHQLTGLTPHPSPFAYFCQKLIFG